MVNGIVSINRPGAQWRELDSKYPPWQSVYYHFGQFKIRGIWEELLGSLAVKERVGQKREEMPSRLAIDSHSIIIRQFIEEETGVEGNTTYQRAQTQHSCRSVRITLVVGCDSGQYL
jgi:hypothetical protein